MSAEKDEENVEDINSDNIPLAKKYSDSVVKRLRSNKGKVVPSKTRTPKKVVSEVPSVTVTPKTKTKTIVVGQKKDWSKVQVKSIVGKSRERNVVSSSESQYDVEEDVQDIIPSISKKYMLGTRQCKL